MMVEEVSKTPDVPTEDTNVNVQTFGERKKIPMMPEGHVQLSHGKNLRGHARDFALEKLRQLKGNRNECGHDGTQTFDHIEARMYLCYCGKIHQDHSIENGRIICFTCNSVKKDHRIPLTYVQEREREKTAWMHTRDYSSEEGEKHEIMRARWDKWIEGFEVGSTILLKQLVNKAPSECKLGSSVTYRRYLDEDIAAGKFEEFRDDGQLRIRKLK